MPKRRKQSRRRVKPKIHIFCEGEKTEPNYIREYIREFHPACARLKDAERPITIKRTTKNTPKQLVKEAVKLTRDPAECIKDDQVWVMYDREAISKYSEDDHSKAWDQAKRNNIEVALSNVCFEYWVLLHMRESSRPAVNCDDLISSRDFRLALQEIGIHDYEKGQPDITRKLMDQQRIDQAKERARRINEQSRSASPGNKDRPYCLNPFTNVYEVLEAIDEIAS
ncbi:RloB family protein [Natronospirillum operosum]|nr:RloB family protein [Natronospirillum operosum]